MSRYLRAANRPVDRTDPTTLSCGDWTPGDGTDLFGQGDILGYVQVGLGPFRHVYEISLWHDLEAHGPDTGLVFYRADLIEDPTAELVDDLLEGLAGSRMWMIFPGGGRIPRVPIP